MYKNIKFRVATVSDVKEILEIYGPYVEKTAVTFEYEIPSVEEFERRIQNILYKYPYIVAELDGHIVGYSYAASFKERAAYDWSAEVSVYVRTGYKRRGIGKGLYKEIEKILKKQGFLNVNACIAYTEEPDEYLTKDSADFHEKMGYSLAGRFHKCAYKFGRWYDMIWMEKHIGDHDESPPKVRAFNEITNDI